jgi:hypothetical protein
MAARYPVGAIVDVHVEPANPGNAVLDPAETGTLTARTLAATFGIIAAVLIAHAIAGQVLYSSNGVPLFAFLLPALKSSEGPDRLARAACLPPGFFLGVRGDPLDQLGEAAAYRPIRDIGIRVQ